MPHNPCRFQKFRLAVTDPALATTLGWTALSMQVANPTNQWIQATPVDFVSPYTGGAVIPITDELARAQVTAPAGLTNPPTILNQFATITYYDQMLTPSSGQPLIGGRTPYLDRAPVTVVGFYYNSLAPHALTTRATYTVPTARRAHISTIQLVTEIQTAYNAAGVFIETLVRVMSGSVNSIIKDAYTYQTNAVGSRDEFDGPVDFFLVAGDVVTIETRDLGVGGTAYHFASVSLLEFDV